MTAVIWCCVFILFFGLGMSGMHLAGYYW